MANLVITLKRRQSALLGRRPTAMKPWPYMSRSSHTRRGGATLFLTAVTLTMATGQSRWLSRDRFCL